MHWDSVEVIYAAGVIIKAGLWTLEWTRGLDYGLDY